MWIVYGRAVLLKIVPNGFLAGKWHLGHNGLHHPSFRGKEDSILLFFVLEYKELAQTYTSHLNYTIQTTGVVHTIGCSFISNNALLIKMMIIGRQNSSFYQFTSPTLPSSKCCSWGSDEPKDQNGRVEASGRGWSRRVPGRFCIKKNPLVLTKGHRITDVIYSEGQTCSVELGFVTM